MTTGGVRLSYLGEGASASKLEAVFAPTPAMVAFFEGKAGLPLPGGRYTQLLTPGAEAQEAAGFSLIGRKVIEPMLADPQEDWAIAHELAHQWWGNLRHLQGSQRVLAERRGDHLHGRRLEGAPLGPPRV
jgi:aminopeptidase N